MKKDDYVKINYGEKCGSGYVDCGHKICGKGSDVNAVCPITRLNYNDLGSSISIEKVRG